MVTDEIVYLTADEEDDYIIAQANEPIDEDGRFARQTGRRPGMADEIIGPREAGGLHGRFAQAVVSVATALIPFLENDDADRALMGANMQRQAVPLARTDAPLVGPAWSTGRPGFGVVVMAENDGVVERVTADGDRDARPTRARWTSYRLMKFLRSNQGTCINQRPIVDRASG